MNSQAININEARRLANSWEKALQLREEGYTFSYDADTNTVFVCKPGRLYAEYTIGEQLTGRDGCSCPDFQKHGNQGKNTLAWEDLCNEEAAIARYEAEEANAECAGGVDYRL